MSNLKLERRWLHRNDRFRRRLDAQWFSYLQKLGFEGKYLNTLSVAELQFNPSFWLEDWNAFAYVIPRDCELDSGVATLIREANLLSHVLPEYDIFVFIGRPGASGEIKLFSPEVAASLDASHRTSLWTNRWKLVRFIDWVKDEISFWLPFSVDGIMYSPTDRAWCDWCCCGLSDCDLCKAFSLCLPRASQDSTGPRCQNLRSGSR